MSNSVESGIYRIRNLVNDKCYVGSTKNFNRRRGEHFRLLVKNKHWNSHLQWSYNKYSPENFVFEILEQLPYVKESILSRENCWINQLNSKKNGFNIADASFGDQLSNHPNREEIIKKISIGVRKTLDAMSDEERKLKFGKVGNLNPMYGKKISQSTLDALSAGLKIFILTHGCGPTKGIKKTIQHRNKMSECAKLKIGEKNPFYGKKHSQSSKDKMSIAGKGRPCNTLHPIIMDGVRYERLKDASAVVGISISTLWFRAKSKNPKFSNIYFVDAQ